MMRNILIIVFLTIVGILFSCKNTNSPESEQTINTDHVANEVTEKPVKEKTKTILYAWVDKLRIRAQPSTKSEIIDEVKEGTSFTYLNEKTDFKEKINLRGSLYDEPWLKIKTEDGKEGWVFGGAVKFYEPVVDMNPSPYDACFALIKDGKYTEGESCTEKVQKAQLKKDKKRVQQDEMTLTLALLTGEQMVLKNDTTPMGVDSYFVRVYSHYIPQLGFFVIDNIYHEGGNYSLINDKSGKETIIQGFPKPSADFKHIVTTNADAEAGFEFNGIEVYGYPDGRFAKVFEEEVEASFEPHTPIWVDNKTVEVTMVPTTYNNTDRPKKIKITQNDSGKWEIQE
ncbi:MAG: SH3 domain-containing protein [Bacteroidota bacterium]